jgi:hypothetical protein
VGHQLTGEISIQR